MFVIPLQAGGPLGLVGQTAEPIGQVLGQKKKKKKQPLLREKDRERRKEKR